MRYAAIGMADLLMMFQMRGCQAKKPGAPLAAFQSANICFFIGAGGTLVLTSRIRRGRVTIRYDYRHDEAVDTPSSQDRYTFTRFAQVREASTVEEASKRARLI